MEDITTRAIIIGVSVLIAVATISSVMTYYSTAQEMVRKIGAGTDIAGLYEQGIEDILRKDKATGVEIKNLVYYFENTGKAQFTFKKNCVLLDTSESKTYVLTNDLPAFNNVSENSLYKSVVNQLIPTEYYKINYTLNDSNVISIEISQI